jgi:ATP-dependent DNA helicase RecG
MYDHIGQFEPLLPASNRRNELLEKAHHLQRVALAARGNAHTSVMLSIAPLLRAMNSYYTNRIEGQHDALWFANEGSFIPGSVEKVLVANESVHRYRNPCLADAMVELGLIDTIGSGIKRMYRTQRERYFPLPDFELKSNPGSVRVRIYGRELDTAFSRALLSGMDLTLEEVIALDRVQKRMPLSLDLIKPLRKRGLVEGRGTTVRISGAVAKASGREVSYTVDRGLDSQHYKALVVQLLKLGPQARPKINQLLLDKLPGAVAPEKRAGYIKSLLRDMAREGVIETDGAKTKAAKWRLRPDSGLERGRKLPNE